MYYLLTFSRVFLFDSVCQLILMVLNDFKKITYYSYKTMNFFNLTMLLVNKCKRLCESANITAVEVY